MTYEEARVLLEATATNLLGDSCSIEDERIRKLMLRKYDAIDLAIEALKKQIPTTVKKDEVDCRGYTDLFICGKCGTYIQTPLLTKNCEYNYCPWCGNRLERVK